MKASNGASGGEHMDTKSNLLQRGRRVSPVEQGSLSARCYLALRNALLDGSFRPGDRIVMRDVADMLGTSVTPIREACLRLVSEFALEIRSRRFIHVPDVTLRRYEQLKVLRTSLEGLAAKFAAEKITKSRIAQLRKIHVAYVSAEAERRVQEAFRSNREFHLGVCEAAGLDMLYNHIEMLWVSMSPILVVYYGEITLKHLGGEEHVNLLDALERRDGAAAQRAMRRDIELGSDSILDHLAALDALSD
ncbi:GntR family transcriptional regulator [Mesorhizobium sp.]|uniref:GntR family transcriptional regulator n=1 Tax=Mesorhizobium sp. TaxID=1871066 RepID=UPI0025B86965|nr:GntR family transcriptional regulator [Mesorhizobium sp.]